MRPLMLTCVWHGFSSFHAQMVSPSEMFILSTLRAAVLQDNTTDTFFSPDTHIPHTTACFSSEEVHANTITMNRLPRSSSPINTNAHQSFIIMSEEGSANRAPPTPYLAPSVHQGTQTLQSCPIYSKSISKKMSRIPRPVLYTPPVSSQCTTLTSTPTPPIAPAVAPISRHQVSFGRQLPSRGVPAKSSSYHRPTNRLPAKKKVHGCISSHSVLLLISFFLQRNLTNMKLS